MRPSGSHFSLGETIQSPISTGCSLGVAAQSSYRYEVKRAALISSCCQALIYSVEGKPAVDGSCRAGHRIVGEEYQTPQLDIKEGNGAELAIGEE